VPPALVEEAEQHLDETGEEGPLDVGGVAVGSCKHFRGVAENEEKPEKDDKEDLDVAWNEDVLGDETDLMISSEESMANDGEADGDAKQSRSEDVLSVQAVMISGDAIAQFSIHRANLVLSVMEDIGRCFDAAHVIALSTDVGVCLPPLCCVSQTPVRDGSTLTVVLGSLVQQCVQHNRTMPCMCEHLCASHREWHMYRWHRRLIDGNFRFVLEQDGMRDDMTSVSYIKELYRRRDAHVGSDVD